MPKHWLDDLKSLHQKMAKQRAALSKHVTESRREERRVKEVLLGRQRATRARNAAAASARDKKRAEDARKNREHFGAPSTSSIVEKADDNLEGRGEIQPGLDGDNETV